MTISAVNSVQASSAPAPNTRTITEQDWPFIYDLFKTTRAWEMSLVDWSAAQKEAFLQQQFNAQKMQYVTNYPMGEHKAILLDGQLIGRIYTAELKNEMQLLDIIITPQARNQGVGSQLMQQLQAEAKQANKPLRFYVWQLNHAAQRFYKRHGCHVLEEKGAYIHMEWKPDNPFEGGDAC